MWSLHWNRLLTHMCSHCPFTFTPFFNRFKRSTNKYGSINLHPGNLTLGESTFGWNKLLPLRLGNICKVHCWLWLMLWYKVGTHLVTRWYKTLQQQITFFAQIGEQVARNIVATNHLVYIGECLWKTLCLQQNFVAATSYTNLILRHLLQWENSVAKTNSLTKILQYTLTHLSLLHTYVWPRHIKTSCCLVCSDLYVTGSRTRLLMQ